MNDVLTGNITTARLEARLPTLGKGIDPAILKNNDAKILLEQKLQTLKEPRAYILSQEMNEGTTASKNGNNGKPYKLVTLVGVDSDLNRHDYHFLSLNNSPYVMLTYSMLERIQNYNATYQNN